MTPAEVLTPANAIERVISAVEILALAAQPVRLSDIAHHLRIPKSAVHRILGSLIDRGWVEQTHGDTYALTLRMPLLGQRMLAQFADADLRQPILDHLAQQTGELVRLAERRGDELVWIGSARGRSTGLVYAPDMNGRIVPFATEVGKAWLAALPFEDAERIAKAAGIGKRRDLPRTITTVASLQQQLDVTRGRGYGLSLEEAEEGVAAIGLLVAIGDHVLGAISVAAPTARFGPARIEDVLPLLRHAAQSISLVWPRPPRPDPAAAS